MTTMTPNKTATSVAREFARQLAADDPGDVRSGRQAIDRHREAKQFLRERERRAADLVGKIFKRLDHVHGRVHVGFVVSRVGSEHVLVRLLDPVTGVPKIDGIVLLRLDALSVDFDERHISVTFYDDAVSYVAAHRLRADRDPLALPTTADDGGRAARSGDAAAPAEQQGHRTVEGT